MAVTKAKKAEDIQKLKTDLEKASSMIVGTFSKLTVAKDYELRKTVRSAGARYRVVKNTLGNVPEREINAQHCRTPCSSQPATFFFKA